MQHKVTFAYIVVVSKVYDSDEDTASNTCYAETQTGEPNISALVPEGFTVERIEHEDTIWDVEEVDAPPKEFSAADFF